MTNRDPRCLDWMVALMHVDLEALIGKLNAVCRQGLEEAAALCLAQTNYNVEIEHVLLRLLELPDTDLHQLLRAYRCGLADVTRELTRAIDRFKRGNTRTPSLSPHLLRDAWLIASLCLNEPVVRSGALLWALLDHETLRGVVLESCPTLLGIPRDTLRQEIRAHIRGSREDSASRATASGAHAAIASPSGSDHAGSAMPALEQYTIDLTARAWAGQLDPIQGRDAEIRQIINVLLRRRQNNPILVGDGVAVVQDHVLEAEADRMGVKAALTPVRRQARR